MDVEIQVVGGDEIAEITDLWAWLRNERNLVGKVQAAGRAPRDTELGGATDVLIIALGSGGTGAVLAQSLTTWLRTRRSNVEVSVTAGDTTVTVNAENIGRDDVLPILGQVLGDVHD
jgi:hypothetical protein